MKKYNLLQSSYFFVIRNRSTTQHWLRAYSPFCRTMEWLIHKSLYGLYYAQPCVYGNILSNQRPVTHRTRTTCQNRISSVRYGSARKLRVFTRSYASLVFALFHRQNFEPVCVMWTQLDLSFTISAAPNLATRHLTDRAGLSHRHCRQNA